MTEPEGYGRTLQLKVFVDLRENKLTVFHTTNDTTTESTVQPIEFVQWCDIPQDAVIDKSAADVQLIPGWDLLKAIRAPLPDGVRIVPQSAKFGIISMGGWRFYPQAASTAVYTSLAYGGLGTHTPTALRYAKFTVKAALETWEGRARRLWNVS